MTAPETLRELTAMGVRIDVRGDRLHVRAPKGVLTEEVQERLRRIKPHLIELLSEPPAYRRAATLSERCDRCRRLEAEGVTVLLCSECDVRITRGGD